MSIRRWLYLITFVLGVVLPSCAQQNTQPGQVFSNVGGLLIASNFNQFNIPEGTTPTNSQIQWPNNKMCQPTSGGTTFQAFRVGSPITIVDANPANTEVVTVTNFNSNTYGCQMQAVMTHTHYSYTIQSATFGLQEAINAALNLPYQVIVTPDWQRMGGVTSQIINAKGNFNVTILDQRSSVIVPYLWNGSIYVATPFGSGAACGTAGDIQASSGSGFTCDPAVTLDTTTHTISTPNLIATTGVTTPVLNGLTWPIAAPLANGQCLTSTIGLVGSFGDCAPNQNPGFQDELAANAGIGDTVLQLNTNNENGYGEGYLLIDSEWIKYTNIAAGQVHVYPSGRGYFGTTAASHGTTAQVNGATAVFASPTQLPLLSATGNPIAGTAVVGIGTAFPYNYNGQATAVFNSGNNAFMVDHSGAFHQLATSSPSRIVRTVGAQPYPYGNEMAAPLYVGSGSTAPITDTSFLEQVNVQDQITVPQGFSGGIAGPLTTIQSPTVAAPYVYTQFAAGSTTWSYVCQGVDSDGNSVPGTAGNVVTAASLSFPGANNIACPPSAGVASFRVYRTAGGPNIGFVSTTTPPYGTAQDLGGALDGTSPAGSNNDVPRLCNNSGQFCILSGVGSTPPLTCTAPRAGWEYHDVSATTTPFVYHCISGSWATAY